ncbi:FUSC family protein [Trinickia terrae]|uniref:FUSC family protein n=1 Tax=Trinickia terrae TaxID=2571161 RepID=A0A4U1HGZ3_9BURK|nr:FUSC family protein [Trinickia terrae]TKC80335.1 FUSC family protein [Trinickia terrae]
MSSPASSTPQTPRTLQDWYAIVADWARTDGATWIYLFKALLAAFLTLLIAMRLEMSQPKTAMATVFIVMQPQSGAVLAKSFYRFCGTLVGLVATLTLVGLFAQRPELFMTALAIWVGICTAGAARNRNFRSYGFLLAGYTAALIGLPAAQAPNGAFLSALTRVSEVSLGIACAGIVSALVFPQHTGERMRTTVRARFSAFVEYVSAALAGRTDRTYIEQTNARFLIDIVGFEAMRSLTEFEGPDARQRSGQLSRLNSEFMTASTRFHALHQLMNRLHDAGAADAIQAIEPYFKEIAPLLNPKGATVLTAVEAGYAADELEAYKAALPRRVREQRAAFENRPGFPLLDFDTASELLYRFVDDMLKYSRTYASLAAVEAQPRERWIEHYEPKTNLVATIVAGLRGAIVMAALSWFWLATAWPSGTMLVSTAAAVCALASSAPNPTRTSNQMGLGIALSVVAAFIVEFGVYPHIDGFALLCIALVPFLAFGIFLSTRPALAGYGAGYLIFFCNLAGPDNVINYDPSGFMNDAIALVLSTSVAAIAFSILLPPATPWLRNHLFADMRRQVLMACHAGLERVRSRFESGTRDLAFQAHQLAEREPEVRRDTLRWLVSVLEVGNAIIDLRQELAMLPPDPRYAATMPWRKTVAKTREAITSLFSRPDAKRLDTALAATGDAIAAVQQTLVAFAPPREERRQLQRILSHLHFIRTALLDPQSPLETFVGNGRGAAAPPPSGAHHAS